MRRAVAMAVVAAGLASPVACKSPTHSLSIDLRTDFQPGLEFLVVHTDVHAGGDAHQFDVPAVAGDATFATGRRIADLSSLPRGEVVVTIAIRQRNGTRVRRIGRLNLTSDYAFTVVMTRSCDGVVCPGEESCVGGKCASPECIDLDVECTSKPPPACTTDAECPVKVPCMRGKCDSGVCMMLAIPGSCGGGTVCDPKSGCVPPPPPGETLGPDPEAGSGSTIVCPAPL